MLVLGKTHERRHHWVKPNIFIYFIFLSVSSVNIHIISNQSNHFILSLYMHYMYTWETRSQHNIRHINYSKYKIISLMNMISDLDSWLIYQFICFFYWNYLQTCQTRVLWHLVWAIWSGSGSHWWDFEHLIVEPDRATERDTHRETWRQRQREREREREREGGGGGGRGVGHVRSHDERIQHVHVLNVKKTTDALLWTICWQISCI